MNSTQICSRCILDTTVPGINFDENGVCNYCKLHDKFEQLYPLDEKGQLILNEKIARIKKKGKGKKYDCIVGLSGGRDSCYMIDWAVKSGLKPLAVFYDSGWYSDQSKENITKVAGKLGVDVETVTCDMEEYHDIQRSFLLGSTNDIDAPDDQAIIAVLIRAAVKHNIHYILSGHSFRTEGNTPIGWSYMDGRYVKDVHKKFGKIKLKTYPILSMLELINAVVFHRIKYIYPLEYVVYKKDDVTKYLEDKFEWVYAGGHHYDCQYIHLIGRVLRKKFNIDKRKVEFSALIRDKQLTRINALNLINNNKNPESDELVNYSMKRLGITGEEFKAIMKEKPKSFFDYKTYFAEIRLFRFPIRIACKMGILPMTLYEKYVKLGDDLKKYYANR